MIMGDVESDEHLRIFKCLIDTGSIVLRNAIGIKVLNNNSIGFVQYLENYKHQFYHQFEKNIRRKCCQGSPHGCNFNGIMDKKIFYKMYNKTAEHNSRDCLDRFETNAGISLDVLDLSDLNFFLWNSSSLSPQEEHSLKKIMSIRSAICHPSSSHSYSIDELEIYWSDLKSAVLLFVEPKCYKDIVEMQVETLQNCKLNVIESAKVIEKMKIESAKILHAIKQETPLKIVDIEKLIKDGTCGLENCVKSENNKTQSYINDTFQEFKENIKKHHEVLSTSCREKIQTTVTQESSNIRLHSEDQSRAIDTKLTESEQRVCQTVIQSQGRLEDKLIEEQNKTRNHTVELKADIIEENRILKDEVMDVKTELKELKTILIGYIGKQKVDLVINTDQIGKSTESPDTRKVGFTAKVNQTHVTADEENEIIEKLPPEVEIQTNNEGLPDAAVTETIEITGKKVNSIILELKATPGILHSVETFKAAILSLVQVIQKAGGIDADIEDTVTVNLKFESPLTEDQFAVVKCLFAKEWNADNDTTQLPETSEVFQLETTKPITKTFCQLCDNKDRRIKALEKHEIVIMRNMLDLQREKIKLEDLLAEKRKLEDLQVEKRKLEDIDVHDVETKADMKLMELHSSRGPMPIFDQIEEKRILEIRREHDLLKITDQNPSMTRTEEKGRIIDKEFHSDRSSQDSKLISARNSYTKTDAQKGLGIIIYGDSSRYFPHSIDSDIRHLQEFFEEIGFVTNCIGTCTTDIAQLNTYMREHNFYCIFIVVMGYLKNEDEYLIRFLLSQQSKGKPVIIMTNSTYNFPQISKINEDNDMLIVMPIDQTGRGRDSYRYRREKNIFDDFVKAARRNRFADIMDILTRMNALYDFPIITFQSSLKKKFCFL